MTKTILKTCSVSLLAIMALGACKGSDKQVADKAAVEKTAEKSAKLVSVTESIRDSIEVAQKTTGNGDPAIWKLSDEDTNIYFMGTVHILPDDIQWKTAKFDEIFAEADTIYMEADTSAEAQASGQQVVMQYAMFSEGQTLSGVLGDDRDKVAAAFADIGVPLEGLDAFKPWMASMTGQVMALVKDGYNPQSGVEMVLTAAANESGKEFGYFETIEEQIKILASGTMEEQVEGLVFMSEAMEIGKESVDVLVDEWADGDVKGLSAMIADPELLGGKEAYDRLLTQRNQNWIPQIEAILDDPGTKLIAVGAAHLAGPDSVITMLEANGHEVEVVQ